MVNPDGITDPTGGQKNFNIYDEFQKFGYTPTQAEIDALAPAFAGRTNVEQTGLSAVSQYVIAHQAEAGAQSLVQGQLKGDQASQAQADALGKDYAAQGTASLQSAADVYNSAPQLFGGLSQDQVGQYLKPLQNQFDYGLGQVTGQAAARGLSGSSVEATAMSQAQTQYQQQVLQQALQLGLQQQQQRSQALQAQGSGQLTASNNFTSSASNYGAQANQLLGQNTSIADTQAQLPGQATNSAIDQNALLQLLNPQKQSFGGQLLNNFQNLGVNAITNMGGNIVNGLTGGLSQPPNSSGGTGTGNPSGPNLLASLLSSLRGPSAGSVGAGAAGAVGGQEGLAATGATLLA